MKSKYMIPLLFLAHTALGQLTITPGAQVSIFSDTKLTLQNTDLINNGSFLIATTSPVSFTGNITSVISGDEAVRFFKLEINKTGNQSVSLRKTIGVGSDVLFTAGFLDLNGFDLDLGATGRLVNENENSRVIGANGGQVLATAVLNGPSLENPGNLGAIITSTQNLGNVTIKRGHQSQRGNGLTNSILRYYDVTPANNINLDASLQLNYFDGELNGLDENTLVFFKTDDGVNWTSQGFNSRSTAANFVAKTGIGSFSRWTLSNNNTVLPVLFTLFNAKCEGNRIALTWKTAQEQNSDHFDIERSFDGIHWVVIGRVSAAGNSSSERTYSFNDNNPGQKNSYRIAEYDIDRRAQYTTVLASSCNLTDKFSVWPNPVHDLVVINIVTSNDAQATVRIFDAKGALVKMQRESLLQGSNQLRMDLRSLSNGAYSLSVEWNNGQMKKAVQVLKQ